MKAWYALSMAEFRSLVIDANANKQWNPLIACHYKNPTKIKVLQRFLMLLECSVMVYILNVPFRPFETKMRNNLRLYIVDYF